MLTETDSLLSKLDQKINVLMESVSLVTLNVLDVPLPLIIAIYVLLEEKMPQIVPVQMDTILMKISNVDYVTLNVELVLLIMSVLNVLINLTELTQVNVHVMMDIMILVLLFVQLVIQNVSYVENTTFVK